MRRRIHNVKIGDIGKICGVTSDGGDVYPVVGYDRISASVKLRTTCFVITDYSGEPDDLFVSWDSWVYLVDARWGAR